MLVLKESTRSFYLLLECINKDFNTNFGSLILDLVQPQTTSLVTFQCPSAYIKNKLCLIKELNKIQDLHHQTPAPAPIPTTPMKRVSKNLHGKCLFIPILICMTKQHPTLSIETRYDQSEEKLSEDKKICRNIFQVMILRQ